MNDLKWQRLRSGWRAALAAGLVGAGLGFGGCAAGDPVESDVGVASQPVVVCDCVPTGECVATECMQRVKTCTSGISPRCSITEELCEARIWTTKEKIPPKCEDEKTGAAGVCTTRPKEWVADCCVGCAVAEELTGFYTCNAGTTLLSCGRGGSVCRACGEDSNPCTKAACVDGNCDQEPIANGEDCSIDGEEGVCLNGNCCTGCRGENDECIPIGAQPTEACGTHGAACKNCDDGNFCNGEESCLNGACQEGETNCTASNQCGHEECNSDATGCDWVAENVNQPCNDGDVCTASVCSEDGACEGPAVICPQDDNPCTENTCSEATNGCGTIVNLSGDCDYGCVTGGECVEGVCSSDDPDSDVHCEPRECFNLVGCDLNAPTGEQCLYQPNDTPDTICTPSTKCITGALCGIIDSNTDEWGCVDSGEEVVCEDDNPCTNDSCDDATGCVNAPNNDECADGDLCTTGDRCREDGSCTGTPVVCEPSNDCRELAACNAANGACSEVVRPDTEGCVDENGADGTCQDGFCIPNETGAGGAGGAGGASTIPSGGDSATTGGSAGATSAGSTSVDPSQVYHRDPRGCSCRVGTNESSRAPAGLALLLSALGIAWWRRRRSA